MKCCVDSLLLGHSPFLRYQLNNLAISEAQNLASLVLLLQQAFVDERLPLPATQTWHFEDAKLILNGGLLLSIKRYLNMTKIRTSETDPLKILLTG